MFQVYIKFTKVDLFIAFLSFTLKMISKNC